MLRRIINKIQNTFLYIYYTRKFGQFGNGSIIVKPYKLQSTQYIYIGSNVYMQAQIWLAAHTISEESPILFIGDNCVIGRLCEIYATKSIIIENNVLVADRVYISDNLHEYSKVNLPVLEQPIRQVGTVVVGAGSWLGVGVAVIGANIGKHCVIGANAVVTHDIPDYSVAVGIPAKVIKRYNFSTKRWEKTNPDGSFIENK